MDAAQAALEREDVWASRVASPRVLTPLFPRSLISPGSADIERATVGPESAVPWPAGAAWLEYEPKVAAVLGREGRRITIDDIQEQVRVAQLSSLDEVKWAILENDGQISCIPRDSG